MNLARLLRAIGKFVMEIELHEGVAIAYEHFPPWAKIIFWTCGGALAVGGLIVVIKKSIGRPAQKELWVKIGDKIHKGGKERVVRVVEVDSKDEDTPSGPETGE